MKKEALDILKANLDLVYAKYYTENTNKWLWEICGGNPFEIHREIADFELTSLDSELSIGEVEFNNCKMIFKNLSFLSESQASDERLWAGLCHSEYYSYVRKRWGYDISQPKSAKLAVSNIKSRFFFSGSIRSGLYRNTIAKCWWVGRNTYDSTKDNSFEKLDIIGSNDISSKISDIFYSNTFASNPSVLEGIIQGLKYFKDENITLTVKEHIRPTLQLLNAVGGGLILDYLSEEEISDIFIDNILGIVQGDELGIEVSLEDGENLEESVSGSQNEITTISIGHKVIIENIVNKERKIIKVDFLEHNKEIPQLAKKLIGRAIGEEVYYNGITFIIVDLA